jgi:hypothetical protein
MPPSFEAPPSRPVPSPRRQRSQSRTPHFIRRPAATARSAPPPWATP